MSELDTLWSKAWDECKGDIDLTNARVGGRATKENPNKEDAEWWNKTGPKWLSDYVNWRKNNPDWKIWTLPDGTPAVEFGLMPTIGGVLVKMFIDRVFEVNGQLVIVDLKTSRSLPASALQLGFYKIGIQQMLGVEINFGNYYMSRNSGTGEMIDLSGYTYDKIEYLVNKFEEARQAGIFLPNNNNCNTLCGLTQHCNFYTPKIG